MPRSMIDFFTKMLDKMTTITAGFIGTVTSSFVGLVRDIDWMIVLGIVTALLTALAQAVKIWAEIREDRRREHKHSGGLKTINGNDR